MTYTSTLSSKGQLTIPREVRVRLGLKKGDRVEFVVEDGRTLIRPARTGENPFTRYAGILDTFPGGLKEVNAWIRDMREDDE